MNKNIHFYVNPKNGWAWLMAVCLAGSAISRSASASHTSGSAR